MCQNGTFGRTVCGRRPECETPSGFAERSGTKQRMTRILLAEDDNDMRRFLAKALQNAGYDVLSFDLDGRERLIEVKTTAFAKETPFFLSRNELALSRQEADAFHLYRVFAFRRRPQLFDLPGRLEDRCQLDPVSYLARF